MRIGLDAARRPEQSTPLPGEVWDIGYLGDWTDLPSCELDGRRHGPGQPVANMQPLRRAPDHLGRQGLALLAPDAGVLLTR